MDLNQIIRCARGDLKADLLLANARIINVFAGEIFPGNIAVTGGYIAGFGDYAAKKVIDLKGDFVVPGLIDAHVHIESSMTSLTEFARAVLPCGTTSVVADPHEIANVLGTRGLDYMLDSAKQQPLNFYFTLPSCVPATHMETAGACLTAKDLQSYWKHPKIVALAEMMNYPGVIFEDDRVLSKISQARGYNRPIDGHAPGLKGLSLNAYLAAGIASDHECSTAKEAKAKLDLGMHIMVRQGIGARNLRALAPIINNRTAPRMMWCTDDRHPHDLLEKGHIDSIIRQAIELGVDPVIAIQMATFYPAEYFNLRNIGAIAPGRRADLLILKDLEKFKVSMVYSRGNLVAKDSNLVPDLKKPAAVALPPTMNVDCPKLDFSIPVKGENIRVIEIIPNQLITRQLIVKPTIKDNLAVADPDQDLLKIAVVERHQGTGNIGLGFVRGLKLKKGAIASSVAHDSHNIIIAGTNDQDMLMAVKTVVKMQGGLALVCDKKVLAVLELPIAGLMSLKSVETVKDELSMIIAMTHDLGCLLKDPFMTLGFLALPVIPELKITDQGIVDVNRFQLVSLFIGEKGASS